MYRRSGALSKARDRIFCVPMRRAATLFALGLMMVLLHRATASGPLEARASLALGFLLVAAYLGGDLAGHARLPRITGYLLAGFAVGPAWLGLVRREEVDALGFLTDATTALIALAAGSALTLDGLRRGRTAVARLATGAMAFPFVAVTLVMLSVSPWFPITLHQPLGDALAVSLALGVTAAASSPVVTLATLDELGSRGPFARALLGLTIVQGVAAVLWFALVLALGKLFTSAGALSVATAGGALVGLVGSLGAGALLGLGLARYMRLLPGDPPLFLAATAFVVALAARGASLDPTIIALAAGFYLGNWAPVEAGRLRHDLQRGALLVYVPAFALAGAALRLGVLADLWPWALLLVGLRIVGLRYGLRWAGRNAVVTPALARDGWLGLISQAGTGLGLAQLARRAFPEWGVSLETLIVAMIGVHEVAGPICLRAALGRAGELNGGSRDAEAPVGGGSVLDSPGGV
jgi:Kef-type K+ transport system membrane component KefB